MANGSLKRKYDRLYANGVMCLAKGETLLAEEYFSEAALALKDYTENLPYEERREMREWFLDLCNHVKDIQKFQKEQTEREENKAVLGEGERSELAFTGADVPSVAFEDVVGLDSVKEKIFDMVIYPRQYRELYERFRKKAGGGILLYGPPGNGKTMIAKAIAHETGSLFFPVKFSDLGSKWFGESEGKMKALFDEARRAESAVIFFDEIDAIAAKREASSPTDRLVAELLVQMDGIHKREGNLTILAATNRLNALDDAILRPGRFDEKIFIPLPDAAARSAMFEKHLSAIPSAVTDYAGLAARSEGLSGAQIAHVCERAKQKVIRSIIGGASADSTVCESDVLEALQAV